MPAPKKVKREGNRKWKELEKAEDEGGDAEPSKRGKLSEIQKGQLEAEIIAGLPVSEIAGRFEISTNYVYVVKARLKKEGKL